MINDVKAKLFFFFLEGAAAGAAADGGLWSGVLFVQDVVMAWSIEQEDARVAALGEDVVIYSSSFPSVHVLHQNGYVQGLGQGDDVNVVTFFGHGLHLLSGAQHNSHVR